MMGDLSKSPLEAFFRESVPEQQLGSTAEPRHGSKAERISQAEGHAGTARVAMGSRSQLARPKQDAQQASQGQQTQHAQQGSQEQQIQHVNQVLDAQQARRGQQAQQANQGQHTQQISQGQQVQRVDQVLDAQQASQEQQAQQTSQRQQAQHARQASHRQQAEHSKQTQQATTGQPAEGVETVERSLLSSRSSVKDAVALFEAQHDIDDLIGRYPLQDKRSIFVKLGCGS